jgi:hypothetical protein
VQDLDAFIRSYGYPAVFAGVMGELAPRAGSQRGADHTTAPAARLGRRAGTASPPRPAPAILRGKARVAALHALWHSRRAVKRADERPNGGLRDLGAAPRRVKRALPYVPAWNVILAPDCGMKYLPRDVAFGKMQAMVAAARSCERSRAPGEPSMAPPSRAVAASPRSLARRRRGSRVGREGRRFGRHRS